jgi:quinol monooxygenase YgiN
MSPLTSGRRHGECIVIVVHGKYEFLDRSVRPAWEESSQRFLDAGMKAQGCLGFHFAEDVFDPSIVYMTHMWETQEDFSAFTSSPEHDKRIAETKAFEAAEQVRRLDLTFFDATITRRVTAA